MSILFSMAIYGEDRTRPEARLAPGWERYFDECLAPCPYGLAQTAVYRQAMLGGVSERLLGPFLAAGYRRNGNCIYAMECPTCSSCIPIRLAPAEFKPNRNQKRVSRKNADLSAEFGPLRITDERLSLCNRFLRARYPDRINTAEQYYTGFFLCTAGYTYEIEYRLPSGKLIGVSIVDVSPEWMNAVYFYFDPAEARRSPGTFNILHLIDFCRQQGIGLLYLGYWIGQVRAMSYKANFKPHYLLRQGVWGQVEK